MQRNYKWRAFFFLTLATLLVSVFSAGFVLARGQGSSPALGNAVTSAQPAIAPLVSIHTVNMNDVPVATTSSSTNPARVETSPRGVDPTVFAKRKAAVSVSRWGQR